MIGNFSDDLGDLYVFFDDGEVESLESGPVTGAVVDADSPDLEPGSIEVSYDQDTRLQRPVVDRYSGECVGDFKVVIGEEVYDSLIKGEVYDRPAGKYDGVPHGADVQLLPDGETGGFNQLVEELDELEEEYIHS